jgi:hypothetical protein
MGILAPTNEHGSELSWDIDVGVWFKAGLFVRNLQQNKKESNNDQKTRTKIE